MTSPVLLGVAAGVVLAFDAAVQLLITAAEDASARARRRP